MPVVEQRNCKSCGKDFAIDSEDLDFYKKIGVPPPTFCPDCRLRRRMMFRNERNYYRRKCDLCSRDMVACYPQDFKAPVYCQKCWWSDKWDPAAYGRDFDFSRPFFEQYRELADTVPVLSIMNDDGVGSVNSEYTYDEAFVKNCYLGVCGWHVENGMYVYDVNHSKDIMDAWNVNNSELVYGSVNCDRCYNSKYCDLCFDSNNCILSFDLRGCSNCVMCAGLRNKSYCIRNRQYSKEEYEKELEKMDFGSRSGLRKLQAEFREFSLGFPRKYAYIMKSLDSSGFFLIDAKLAKNCFYCFAQIENSKFVVVNDRAKDSYDCSNTGNAELCYESVTPDNSRGNKFSVFCWKCSEAEYSDNCHSCVSVFGCTGLKHSSYAILNKRYPKEEFMALRDRIIAHMRQTGEWGEFFPHWVSPFAYNESAALEWSPMSREEALAAGYRWKDEEPKNYAAEDPESLPDSIQGVGDDILEKAIACGHGGKCAERCTAAFRIIPAELQMYRRMDVPLPTLCPNCRHYSRLSRRNPPKLWPRPCMCSGGESEGKAYKNTTQHFHGAGPCPNRFETSYAPERPEIVYCEQCYNSEIA